MDSPSTLRAKWMIVDDDPAILSLLSRFLGMNGAQTDTAASGLEALTRLQSSAFDVVLTDRNMPGLDGHGLLREIRHSWPDIDVVMMTGMASVKNAVEAMRLGAADYIEKPLDLNAALSIFQRVEEHRRLRQERDHLKAEVALRELSQVITANLHMAELPSRIADLITRVFGVAEIIIHYRVPGEEEDGVLWRSQVRGVAGALEETEQILALESATQGDLLQRRLDGRWLVCIPLLADSQHRGAIFLGRTSTDPAFDEHQLELLRIMASHVNIALENAHLFQVATRQMRGTQKLAEIGRRLNANLEMDDTLQEIHQGVKAFVDCDYSVVVLLERSLDTLHVDISGSRTPNPPLFERLMDRIRERVGRIVDPCFHYADEAINMRTELAGQELATELPHLSWAPMTDNQGSVGMLGVVRLSGRPFPQREIQNFMLLSSSASSALQNSLLFTSMRRLHVETIQVLSKAIDEKDHYTHGHSAQVGGIAVKLARRCGINSPEELEEIHLGGLMHDLGKIGIRDAVLNKPGRLTPEEYDHIKTHPLIGAEILVRAPHLARLAPFVRSHHEHWNGGGYPDGLVGEQTPLKVRILSIADTFHAMASDRIYRLGMPVDSILCFLREQSGHMFDPMLVEQFLDCWQRGLITMDDINYDPMLARRAG